MDRQVGTEPRDDGVTSGSDTRPSRDLAGPVVIDVAEEAGTLFDEPEWAERDRNSRTVATTERMRVTLTALRRGARIGGEATDDTMTVQVLRGSVSLTGGGQAAELDAGQLATLEQPSGWELAATDDALLLLTVALGHGPAERA